MTVTRRVITTVAVAMSVFHLYVAFVGPPDAYVMRGSHLAFALVLAFLIMPGRNGAAERVGWFDVLLVLVAAAAALYPSMNLRLHPEPHVLRRRPASSPTTCSAAR